MNPRLALTAPLAIAVIALAAWAAERQFEKTVCTEGHGEQGTCGMPRPASNVPGVDVAAADCPDGDEWLPCPWCPVSPRRCV